MNNLVKKASLAAMAGLLPVAASADAGGDNWSISGWINEEVIIFDTAAGSDITQVSGNGITLGSRITLAGSAEVAPGIDAGFEVQIEPQDPAQPLLGSETALANVNGLGSPVTNLGHNVYLAGAAGKLTVGLLSTATDNIAVLGDPSVTLWSSIAIPYHNAGFAAGTVNGNAVNYAQFLNCRTIGLGIGADCNGIYRNAIRYDLPTFIEGVGIATSFANDDVFDVAVKWDGSVAGLTAMVHTGYTMTTDAVGVASTDLFQVQFGLMDPATGIFGTAALGFEMSDGAAALVPEDSESYWFKAGIKRGFNSLGDTSIAFQYGLYNDMVNPANANVAGIVTGSEIDRYGFEIVQYLGSRMQIYAVYESMDVDLDLAAGNTANTDSTDTVVLGTTFFY